MLPALVEAKASHYPESAAVEFVGVIDGKYKAAIQAKTDEFVAGGEAGGGPLVAYGEALEGGHGGHGEF